ncbi:MAG: PASTA domain-containing protein, partial [Eubacteriales bacterium]|nr:PASTA domain-containing protein [Eubacteriales bacterium]
ETPEGDTPVGTVIGQYPGEGERMDKDGRLTLYVSTGAHSSYVPTLTGMEIHEAQQKLAEYGLREGAVEYVLSLEEPGTVLGQAPEAGGYVSEGSEIALVVSGQSAAMPDCEGETLENARVLLELNGFEVGEITDVIGSVAPDTVVSQSVSAGRQTLSGEKVNLTVCRLDPNTAWRCNVRVRLEVTTEQSEVRMTLQDADGERTVYREQTPQGEHTLDLTLLSREQGTHMLSVFIGGELIMQKELEFR